MNNLQLGQKLKERRGLLGLSQKDVAEMTGVTFKSVSEIELGIRNPTFEMLNKILDVLGMELKIEVKSLNG